MADPASEPVSESIANYKSELVPTSKTYTVFDAQSSLKDNFTDKSDSGSLPSLKPHHVWSVISSRPLPDDDIVCSTCAQLSYEQLCTTEGQIYHESWAALVENADRGCRLCTFFVDVKFPSSMFKIPWQSGPLFLRICKTNLDLFGSDCDTSWRHGICLPVDIDEPLPGPAKYVEKTLRYPDRSCEKAIEKIRKWINECETAHPNCRKPAMSTLPSRVLNLFHNNSSQIVSLVEGKGLKADYITLSYCWGKEAENTNGQISMCTSHNISRLFQGVSIDALPPLYRDAVVMTQKLGKRYLWIDSLCIIQDSEDDWSKECPRMADIYANSFLTISATSCSNKQESFINTTEFEPHAKLTTIPGTQGQYIHVRPYYCAGPFVPLLHRAWAFQERVLSMRVLHLTSLEMVFQCDYHQAGGCGSTTCRHHWGQKLYSWKTPCSPFKRSDPGDIKNVWYQVVESYAYLGLSYEKDRLPALSSIANLLQQRFLAQNDLRANYVAGLWEHDLVYGLLWSIGDPGKSKAKVLSPYVAPTWSWASTQGQWLLLSSEVCRDLLKLSVVDVQAPPSTSNPFGEISSAYLTVDAPLRKVFTRGKEISKKGLGITNMLVEGFVKFLFGFDETGNYGMLTSEAIWLLPCMKDAILEEDKLTNRLLGTGRQWDGLALELVDEKKQVYKRIGVFAVGRLFGEKRTWHDLGFVHTRVTII